MILLGALINGAAVAGGGLIGMVFKKGIPEKLSETAMKGLALCTMYIGITGSLKGQNALIVILSMIIGIVIGEFLSLERRINQLGEMLENKAKKFSKSKDAGKVSIAEGFVTSSLVVCVGAMAIMGSLQSGVSNDHSILINKSILDFVICIIFASTLGFGVVLSGTLVFAYEGLLSLMAGLLVPFLTEAAVAEITCVGSIILIGLALNMLELTKIRVMNMVPAVFIPMILCQFM